MRDYIEESCGIHITHEKIYLMETRLTTLMIECGCESFFELYKKSQEDKTLKIRDRIIDAMTTNETLWFRDESPFAIMEEVVLDQMKERLLSGKQQKVRIWCAASSTGQEPFSLSIVIHEYLQKNHSLRKDQFEILATDISPTVLYLAMAGRYDHIAITRGLSDRLKERYFKRNNRVWELDSTIKNMVRFKKFNLQDEFAILGTQDIVFCRNVLIYFSDAFKKDVLKRISRVLRPQGYLFLGASESLINYSSDYDMLRDSRGLFYQVK